MNDKASSTDAASRAAHSHPNSDATARLLGDEQEQEATTTTRPSNEIAATAAATLSSRSSSSLFEFEAALVETTIPFVSTGGDGNDNDCNDDHHPITSTIATTETDTVATAAAPPPLMDNANFYKQAFLQSQGAIATGAINACTVADNSAPLEDKSRTGTSSNDDALTVTADTTAAATMDAAASAASAIKTTVVNSNADFYKRTLVPTNTLAPPYSAETAHVDADVVTTTPIVTLYHGDGQPVMEAAPPLPMQAVQGEAVVANTLIPLPRQDSTVAAAAPAVAAATSTSANVDALSTQPPTETAAPTSSHLAVLGHSVDVDVHDDDFDPEPNRTSGDDSIGPKQRHRSSVPTTLPSPRPCCQRRHSSLIAIISFALLFVVAVTVSIVTVLFNRNSISIDKANIDNGNGNSTPVSTVHQSQPQQGLSTTMAPLPQSTILNTLVPIPKQPSLSAPSLAPVELLETGPPNSDVVIVAPSSSSFSPSPLRAEQIVTFINNITLTGRTVTFYTSLVSTDVSAEEVALSWLITTDSLQLVPDTAAHQFQLQQRYALATLWAQRTGLLTSSSESSLGDECEWTGITCQTNNATNQNAVTEIVLESTTTSSTAAGSALLSAELGLLSSLRRFVVLDGQVSGTLPDSIGQWSNLEYFNVVDSSLSGTIPAAVQYWTNLQYFALTGNTMSGDLPDGIALWTNLMHFDVTDCGLSGFLPFSIREWTRLQHFDISGNSMTDDLPESIAQWSDLVYFDVGASSVVSGSLPSAIQSWSNLKHFDANSLDLTGRLEDLVGAWTSLEYFDVGFNALSGSLPASIGNWSNLTYFQVYNNNLSGSLPQVVGRWAKLAYFSANDNVLEGMLPESIAAWTNIAHLDVSFNNLTGVLPEAMGEWTSLEYFNVASNVLNGTLPESAEWSNLSYFSVGGNRLSGTVPEHFGNWTGLEEAIFYFNGFVGSLPSAMCNVPGLLYLYVDCDEVECSCCVNCENVPPVDVR